MNDPKEEIKFLIVAKRWCENCRAHVSHEIGAKPDGTPVKCCMRCDALTTG